MAKGFATEPGTAQTHNVFDSIPGDKLYRSYWRIDQFDSKDFGSVKDWASATAAATVRTLDPLVNCPVVKYDPIASALPAQ